MKLYRLHAGARRSPDAGPHRDRQSPSGLRGAKRELRMLCWLAAALLGIGLLSALPALFIWLELIRPE